MMKPIRLKINTSPKKFCSNKRLTTINPASTPMTPAMIASRLTGRIAVPQRKLTTPLTNQYTPMKFANIGRLLSGYSNSARPKNMAKAPRNMATPRVICKCRICDLVSWTGACVSFIFPLFVSWSHLWQRSRASVPRSRLSAPSSRRYGSAPGDPK